MEDKYLAVLCEIQNMCIGEITMSYKLDAEHIGAMIADVTGMTNPELNKLVSEMKNDLG